MSMTKPTSEQVTFLAAGSGAVQRTALDKFRDSVSVKDFGAKGDGVTDDTAAIQAAINSFPTGWGTVHFPKGVYLVTSTLTVAQDAINLVGDGMRQSQIRFAPTANDICIFVGKGGEGTANGGITVECAITDLFLFSTNTTYTKVGIELKDISRFTLNRVKIGPNGFWSGAGSIGLKSRGREFLWVSECALSADKPLVIGYNDNATSLHADFFTFRDLFLGTITADANITVEDKVNLTNVRFDSVSMSGGSYGFYWNHTTTIFPVSYAVSFVNCRPEQSVDPTKYHFYFNPPSGLYNLKLESCRFGSRAAPVNGLYARNTLYLTIENCLVDCGAGNELLNISGLTRFNSINNFWQFGGSATISGMRLVESSGQLTNSAVRQNAVYETTGLAANKFVDVVTTATTIGIAAGANASIGQFTGFSTISTNNNHAALVYTRGSSGAVSIVSDPTSQFSTTAGTPNKVNVYWDAGTSLYRVENGGASTIFIAVTTNGRAGGY
jgi:hypothetical protein